MPLTNLHSYHYRQLFQNATALPRQWYDKLNNRHCLLPSYRHIKHQPAHTISLTDALYPENFQHSPPPAKRPPIVLEGRSWQSTTPAPPPTPTALAESRSPHPAPTSSAAPGPDVPAAQPFPATSPARQTKTKPPANRKKSVWRKGHGLIERVDKLSGEIFHLVEVET
ncbi:MAG: hypothetical protein KDI15_01870 [Thiothrix sp.]|nr:hypothetical protein [Thiothrix sp.]HPE60535.1 hypothetical protein [Thiolinea sp.]